MQVILWQKMRNSFYKETTVVLLNTGVAYTYLVIPLVTLPSGTFAIAK